MFHLAYADLLDEARQRIRRGFTEAECRIHFRDGDCPTVEEMLAR